MYAPFGLALFSQFRDPRGCLPSIIVFALSLYLLVLTCTLHSFELCLEECGRIHIDTYNRCTSGVMSSGWMLFLCRRKS